VAGGAGELVALEKGTLKPKGSYKAGVEFTSSPTVFEYKGKNLIAVATRDGRMHLLDAAKLDKAVYKTPAFSSPEFVAGAVSSWQDPSGTRWVLAPAGGPAGDVKSGAIVAWKVVDQNGAPALQPGWVSRDMVSPLPPAIVNGVIFAVSSGEFRTSDVKITAAQRAQRSSRAILYALDSATGKELWNSGAAITSFVHSGGLAAGGSRVYVSGYDGTQYAFGFPIEH
jgi:outer membrane protein assembly factor BamB